MNVINEIIIKNYKLLNKTIPILQNNLNCKFLHNLNYVIKKEDYYTINSFEGYQNCGATSYILSYILEMNGIKTKMVKTNFIKNHRYHDHVFLIFDNTIIIDPTFRQIFRDDYIPKNDNFMNNLYNSDMFFFVEKKDKLKEYLNYYNNYYENTYKIKPTKLFNYYDNYIDISKYQDSKKVIEDNGYAINKGKYFYNLNKFFNKNKINFKKR